MRPDKCGCGGESLVCGCCEDCGNNCGGNGCGRVFYRDTMPDPIEFDDHDRANDDQPEEW